MQSARWPYSSGIRISKQDANHRALAHTPKPPQQGKGEQRRTDRTGSIEHHR